MPYRREQRVLAESGIGTILRNARIIQGYTQEYLATCVGMSASSISHIEAGADLRTSTLLRIAGECKMEVYFVPKSAAPFVRTLLDDLLSAAAADRGISRSPVRPDCRPCRE